MSSQRQVSLVLTVLMSLLTALVACQSAPPQVQGPAPERVVTQVVEKVVEKVVQQTVVVEKVVEKPVLITPTPAPVQPGADLAADQTLRFVVRNFGRLDPASEAGQQRPFIIFLWMPLFTRDKTHNIMPWLATRYEVNANSTVYTVYLDPKAVWSDGTPVTAQEAKDYWIYGLHPEDCKGCYLASFNGFENLQGGKDIIDGKSRELPGVVVKDQKTLEFRLINPDPIFVHRLAMYNTGFAKMEDVKKGPTFAADGSARVNGPFMVKAWDIDKKQYEIVQNPKWWGDKKPKITRIIGLEAADENVSFIQWQNNEVDVAWWFTNIRERLRTTEPNSFYIVPSTGQWFFPFKVDLEPMDDLNVRKALTWAVDWDKAIAAAWEGTRNDRVQKGWVTPELQCYKPSNWPEWGYNPDKAKQALAASKYGTADKLGKIRITPGGMSPNYIRTAEIMMEQWKTNLGITNVELKAGSLDAWGQEQTSVQVRRASGGAQIPDPAVLLTEMFSYFSGSMKLQDPDLAKTLADVSLLKRDDPKFCAMIQQAEAKFLGDYPLLPMIWDINAFNVKPWVKGFESNGVFGWYSLLDMYIAKH